ncbi:MAG TPA: hypothetical protein VGL22_18940 [Terracidiphilus sp.]|jgi:uncharacterized protein involved in exopolysaccharide biosynthesis
MKSLREKPDFTEDLRAGLPGPQSAANTVRRMPAAGPQEVFFHLDFKRSLQMHRKLAVGIVVAALVLSLGYMTKRWSTYKAQTLVYVQPSPHKVIESGPGQQWPYDANTYESYIQQQVHDVTRPDVLSGAIKRIPGWQGSKESAQAAADRLGSAVEVTRVGTAYEVQIESTAGSAQEAALIANAVASSYIDSATREQRAGDPQRIELLREERERILKDLAGDRSEQEGLSRKLGVAAVSGSPDPIDDQITQTRAELVKARTSSDEAAAKLTALGGGKASSGPIDAEAEQLVSADPGLVSMKTALNKRRSDLISQMSNLTPNHPQYKQDAEELAKINTSLETMSTELRRKAASEIQQRLKNDLERTASVEARLNGQLAQLTSAAGTAAPRMQRLNELGSDVQRLQNRYAVVDEQYRNLTIENNSPGAVYLASAALPPLHAARAKIVRNGLMLIVAGLVLAFGAALVAHNLDHRVYSAQDVERVLGFAPMAQLPDLQQVGAGVAEEYMLRVAAAVEHAHQQGLLTSCIFTGVAAGAGVSTVSTRVSNMLEAMGRQTVLVDAAGAPQAPQGGEAAGGITDLVHAPRGRRSTALLRQMHDEADEDSVVITDTAPLLVSGETEYLARFVDSAIVVIQSGVTTKAQLREAAQTLQRLEVSSVGFVLNRISLKNANPAFLQSVHAVEDHLRAQARPLDRKPDRKPARTPDRTADQISDRPVAAPAPVESVPAPALPVKVELPSSIVSEQPETEALPVQVEALPEVPAHPVSVDVVEKIAAAPIPQPAAPAAVADLPEAATAAKVETPVEQPVTLCEEAHESAGISRLAEMAAVPAPNPELARTSLEPVAQMAAVVEARKSEPSPARVRARELISRPLRGRVPARTYPAYQEVPLETPPAETRLPDAPPSYKRAAEARSIPASPPAAAVRQPVGPPVEETVVEVPARRVSATGLVPASPAKRFENLAASAAARMTEFAEVKPVAPVAPVPQHIQQAPVAYPAKPTPTEEPVLALATREGEPDAAAYNAASRLGGLRTLMTSLGIKQLHKEAEIRKTHQEPEMAEHAAEPSVARPVERAVFAQPSGDVTASGSRVREVTAKPEIIPPMVVVEPAERPASRPGKSPRVSRWEIADDVETLPSVRGQYRKRH